MSPPKAELNESEPILNEAEKKLAKQPEKVASIPAKPKKKQFYFSASIKEGHGRPIYSVAFCESVSSYEKIFASAGGNRVTIYECLDDGNIGVLQTYNDGDTGELYFTCAWSVDVLTGSPLLAIAGHRGHIKIINVITQSVVMMLTGHGNSVNELKFLPVDASLLVSAGKDESIRLWNILTGVCIAIFAGHCGHRDEVLSLDTHLQGKSIVSSGMDNTIKVWDLEEKCIQEAISDSYKNPKPKDRPFNTQFIQFPSYNTSKVHSDYVDCVRFVGDLIMSKSTGNKVILWKPNPSRGKDAVTIMREYQLTNAELWFVKFSVDSEFETLAVGNKSGKVGVFDVDAESERPLCKLNHPNAKNTVRQTSFSLNGNTIVYCCDDATIWRFDVENSSD